MWRNWSRRKRWLISLGVGLTLVVGVIAGALYSFLRIPTLPLPLGVTIRTERLVLTGKAVTVDLFTALPGPAFALVVNDATHVDAENPTSRAAEWACGRTDPARREVFGRYLLASLRAGLLRDEPALRQLSTATNAAAVHELMFRKPEAFSPD